MEDNHLYYYNVKI